MKQTEPSMSTAHPRRSQHSTLRMIHRFMPMSMRGVLVSLTLCYLMIGPVRSASDIVAASLVTIFSTTLLVLLAISVISGNRLRRGLIKNVIAPSRSSRAKTDTVYARDIAHLLLTPNRFSIPPLFRVKISPRFSHALSEDSVHSLNGQFEPHRPLPLPISFPHRGLWECREFKVSLSDVFGLTVHTWDETLPLPLLCTVHPPPCEPPKLPLISSTVRAGDDMNHETARLGELFDLKQYHPSDGMKRILWKVFAKRGELIARHPERSVSPEGHLLGFVLARRSDDGLAAWATAYLSAAEAQGITVSCGCLGMQSETPWANSARALEDSLIEYAFKTELIISTDAMHQVLEGIRAHIGHAREGGTTLGLFVDAGALENSEIANGLITLRESLLAEGVSCELLLKKNELYSVSGSNRTSFWERFFLEKSRSNGEVLHAEDNSRAEIVRQFINHAALKGITLHQEQSRNQSMRLR